MTCWALLSALLRVGHRVTAYCLVGPSDPFNTSERQAILARLGVEVVVLSGAEYGAPGLLGRERSVRAMLRRVVSPTLATFFPSVSLAPRMKALLGEARPDAVFAYHYDAIAATHGLRVAPRVAGTGDLWHWPKMRRWQLARPKPTLRYLRSTLGVMRDASYCPRFIAQLLNDCDAVGCFGAYDAAWLRQHGVSQCQYFRSPIVDACGSQWRTFHSSSAKNKKVRILLGPSNLTATSTMAGLRLFAHQILPRLEGALGQEGVEVRIVGEGADALPEALSRKLRRPVVQFVGRVEPADAEFLSADIQLVPTPILLGIRLRIITGFSFGRCVIAHTKESLNIPEMVHEENALLASDGAGLAAAIIRAARDPSLRQRLGACARATYERYFAPEVAGAAIVATLERLARERRASLGETVDEVLKPDGRPEELLQDRERALP